MPESAAAEARPSEPEPILVFTVDGQEYGVALASIVEIVQHRGATPVPHADEAIEGIALLRGRMMTVFDLRRCLDRPPRPAGGRAQIMVIDSSGDLLGLVVDSVTRVAAGPAGAPEPLPRGLRPGPAGLHCRALRNKDGYLILLELDAVVRRLS